VTPKLSRHKHWIEFLIRRFDRRGPYGLFFTFGLGVIAAAMWAFGGVLQDVVAGEEIALFDKPLVSFIAEHRVSWLTTAMRGATLLGTAWFIVSLVICAGFLLGVRARSWRPFFFLGSAAGGAGLLDFIAKVVIGRPRPPCGLDGRTSYRILFSFGPRGGSRSLRHARLPRCSYVPDLPN